MSEQQAGQSGQTGQTGQSGQTEQPDEPVVPLYGEPFDSGLARAERHRSVPDPAAACAVYEELLAIAESVEDSPDVRFLRAHLLSDLATVQLTAMDLAEVVAASVERALGLLHGLEGEPMGPLGRQLWLEVLLKTLGGKAELLRRTGDLDQALAALEEAAARLPEFDDPEGLRTAEIGLSRVLLLMERAEWGAAEELASAVLSTTPATVLPTVPRLLSGLGLICSATGRFDLSEDYFARAEEVLVAAGDTGEQQQLVAQRAFAALHRGDLDRAQLLFDEASAVFERQRQFGELAVCEQARGFLAARRGDSSGAGDLMASSLARFQRIGAEIAAADTMLMAARQAYDRGDVPGMQELAQRARDVYQARGVFERCAQVDLMVAETLEDNLIRADHGDQERASIDTALGFALPAALALEAARYDFVTAHARSQWLELADHAMRLVFRLAVRRQDPGLLFELVEHRCAGASLVLDRTPAAPRTASPEAAVAVEDGEDAAGVFPQTGRKAYGHLDAAMTLGGVAAQAAASVGLRVAPPPRVLMSPESGRTALQEYVAAAEFRYHRRIVSEQEVSFWPPTTWTT